MRLVQLLKETLKNWHSMLCITYVMLHVAINIHLVSDACGAACCWQLLDRVRGWQPVMPEIWCSWIVDHPLFDLAHI
jgi:hypothetical protein